MKNAWRYELEKAALEFERQKPVRLKYKTLKLDCEYRLDFLIEDQLGV